MGEPVHAHLGDLSKGLEADGTGKGLAAFVNEFVVADVLGAGETLAAPRTRVPANEEVHHTHMSFQVISRGVGFEAVRVIAAKQFSLHVFLCRHASSYSLAISQPL